MRQRLHAGNLAIVPARAVNDKDLSHAAFRVLASLCCWLAGDALVVQVLTNDQQKALSTRFAPLVLRALANIAKRTLTVGYVLAKA